MGVTGPYGPKPPGFRRSSPCLRTVSVTVSPLVEVGPDGRYQLRFTDADWQTILQQAQPGFNGDGASRGKVPARDTSRLNPHRSRSSSRRRGVSPSEEPLRWDYSDLSDATRGGWTSSEDLHREAQRVAGLTRSARGPTSRWDREFVDPAPAREERRPASSALRITLDRQQQAKEERPWTRDECRLGEKPRSGEAQANTLRPCPFSPPGLHSAGPCRTRQAGEQGQSVPLFTASRFVPVSAPTTTLARAGPSEAKVTWAQGSPRVAMAGPSWRGQSISQAPTQADWATVQDVCSDNWGLKGAPCGNPQGYQAGQTTVQAAPGGRQQVEEVVRPNHWGLVPSGPVGAPCSRGLALSPASTSGTEVQVEEPKHSNKSSLKPEKSAARQIGRTIGHNSRLCPR